MKAILAIKLGRRTVAAVFIREGAIAFHDIRYIGRRREAFESSALRFLTPLIDQLAPEEIACYAPTTAGSLTARVAQLLEAEARKRQIPLQRLNKTDLLAGFGVVPLPSRAALANQVALLWPLVGSDKGRSIVLAEAAAAGLLAHIWSGLPPL